MYKEIVRKSKEKQGNARKIWKKYSKKRLIKAKVDKLYKNMYT